MWRFLAGGARLGRIGRGKSWLSWLVGRQRIPGGGCRPYVAPMNKTLMMLVGLPRSGKTTRAVEIASSRLAPIVSPDCIRRAIHGQPYVRQAERLVWSIAHTMVTSLFGLHDTVILDACNTTRVRRGDWEDPRWTRVFVPIETPSDVCITRAGGDAGLIEAIKRMSSAYEPVTESETY